MKLADWLKREKAENGLTRTLFAERIGVSPATITSLCNGGWASKDTAEAIFRETGHEVAPNDLAVFFEGAEDADAESAAKLARAF